MGKSINRSFVTNCYDAVFDPHKPSQTTHSSQKTRSLLSLWDFYLVLLISGDTCSILFFCVGFCVLDCVLLETPCPP